MFYCFVAVAVAVAVAAVVVAILCLFFSSGLFICIANVNEFDHGS